MTHWCTLLFVTRAAVRVQALPDVADMTRCYVCEDRLPTSRDAIRKVRDATACTLNTNFTRHMGALLEKRDLQGKLSFKGVLDEDALACHKCNKNQLQGVVQDEKKHSKWLEMAAKQAPAAAQVSARHAVVSAHTLVRPRD